MLPKTEAVDADGQSQLAVGVPAIPNFLHSASSAYTVICVHRNLMHILISRAVPCFFKTELAPLTGCCHGDLQAVLLLIDIFVVQRLVRRYLTLEHELLILP